MMPRLFMASALFLGLAACGGGGGDPGTCHGSPEVCAEGQTTTTAPATTTPTTTTAVTPAVSVPTLPGNAY